MKTQLGFLSEHMWYWYSFTIVIRSLPRGTDPSRRVSKLPASRAGIRSSFPASIRTSRVPDIRASDRPRFRTSEAAPGLRIKTFNLDWIYIWLKYSFFWFRAAVKITGLWQQRFRTASPAERKSSDMTSRVFTSASIALAMMVCNDIFDKCFGNTDSD